MLQRNILRPLAHHAASQTSRAPCVVCSCACGNVFRGSQNQRRRATGRRKSPSTYAKIDREEGFILSREGAQRKRALEEKQRNFMYEAISGLVNNYPEIGRYLTAEKGVEFLNEFTELARAVPKDKTVVDLDKFRRLVEEFGMSMTHAFVLTLLLNRREQDKALGKKLIFSLSACGEAEATIRICNHALLGHKAQPNLLRSSEINYARGHLREMARQGINFRVMVLEGKIARALGDEEYAIRMWNDAMAAAVAHSERAEEVRKHNKLEGITDQAGPEVRDISELSSPWIELTQIHLHREHHFRTRDQYHIAVVEREKARQAMQTGCAQDDPTSHYHAAAFFERADEGGAYTSTWLYHMTKAAASGHAMACHAMAEFYAESGWKYIEDEPPDYMKPTPFDSYPAPAAQAQPVGPVSNLLRTLGLSSPQTPAAPNHTPKDISQVARDEIFQIAIFPSTPVDRWKLANRWLEPAMEQMYAPSYLYAAKMLVQKTLWAQAQAPEAALKLTDARYTYANKEDYEAGKPLNEGGEASGEAAEEDIPLDHNVADTIRAKSHLVQVFHAHAAYRLRQRAIVEEQSKLRRRPGTETVDMDDNVEHIGGQGVPAAVREWLRHRDVREMYEDLIEDMYKEATRMCEQHEWDLWDENGGLVYRHGLGQYQQ